MPGGNPPRLFIILTILALLVIWIPVFQQLAPGGGAFGLDTWLILSGLASLGIILLFVILYFLNRR